MAQQRKEQLLQQEGRIDLALNAYNLGQFKSVRLAASAYKVPQQQLSNQQNKITFQLSTTANGQKLTPTEEQTLIRHILDLDARGFALRLSKVADIAD
jgi:hypothetical protein